MIGTEFINMVEESVPMTRSVTETGGVHNGDGATESPGHLKKALHTILMKDPSKADAPMITSVMESEHALNGDGVKETLVSRNRPMMIEYHSKIFKFSFFTLSN
jgi:hypothetical protein